MGLVESGKLPKPLTSLLNTARKYSLWAYQWGLACCAIEMGAAFASPRYDVMRLGVIPLPASPRQADVVVISGTVTDKMVPAIKRLYEQMADPKYVISMGSCTNCGGPYWDSYSVTKGVDQIVPVDVYIPGCPPRPEALLEGIVLLQQRIRQRGHGRALAGRPPRGAVTTPRRRHRHRRRRRPRPPTAARGRRGARGGPRHVHRRARRRRRRQPHRARHGLWVRVDRDAWSAAAEAAKLRLGCTFFDFLSAIDWMPSPWGRYEDAASTSACRTFDADAARSRPALRRRRHPLPDALPPGQRAPQRRPAPRRRPQGRPARRRPAHRQPGPALRRGQLARARVLGDVRHHLRRPPRPAPPVPARRVRGPPAAQGLPAARPAGEAVAGHRRRRAHARRARRRPRTTTEADADGGGA